MTLLAKGRKPDTNFDRIYLWYVEKEGSVTLTEKQEDLKERWSAAFALLCNHHSPGQASVVLQQQYEISQAQSYRDIRNATNLFGDVHQAGKEGYRHILWEYAMKAYQIAAKNKDVDNMIRAIAKMIKIRGLDQQDPDAIDWSQFQPHSYKITMPKPILDLFARVAATGLANLDEMMPGQTFDIPHTEVT